MKRKPLSTQTQKQPHNQMGLLLFARAISIIVVACSVLYSAFLWYAGAHIFHWPLYMVYLGFAAASFCSYRIAIIKNPGASRTRLHLGTLACLVAITLLLCGLNAIL